MHHPSSDKAATFSALHQKGKPLTLYNIWDAGSARAVANAGAPAIATGSWSVAAAQGFADGQALPLDLLLTIVARITASVDLPVTIDFEGGYAVAPEGIAANVAKVIAAGAVGINFEDQVIEAKGRIYPIAEQQARIRAVREAADKAGLALFINARTDLFLHESDKSKHGGLIEQAIERAEAFAEAGASGFFAPGLIEPALVERLCAVTKLPVNIMMMASAPSHAELAKLGVSRISHGPGPYRAMVVRLEEEAKACYAA